MSSKTVLVAFLALFCAQAFVSGAPSDKNELFDVGVLETTKCVMALAEGTEVVEDLIRYFRTYLNLVLGGVKWLSDCQEDSATCEKKFTEKLVIATNATTEDIRTQVLAVDGPIILKIMKDCVWKNRQ